MAELADALDLGSSGRPCRFKSCHPHDLDTSLGNKAGVFFMSSCGKIMKTPARILLRRTTFPLHVKVGQIRFLFF